MKTFLENLFAMLGLGGKRNNCQYCGGVRCYGLCSAAQEKNAQDKKDDKTAVIGPKTPIAGLET